MIIFKKKFTCDNCVNKRKCKRENKEELSNVGQDEGKGNDNQRNLIKVMEQ